MAGGDRENADSVLVAALAAGQPVAAAARAAGMSDRTAYRRLESAEFRAQLAAARHELVDRAVGALADAAAEAAGTLQRLWSACAPDHPSTPGGGAAGTD